MSFLTSRTSMLRSVPRTLQAGGYRFSTSAYRASLNEDATHKHDRDQEIEKAKQESKDHGKWHKDLASNSEAAVKADRGEADASPETIRNMQKEGEELGKRKQ